MRDNGKNRFKMSRNQEVALQLHLISKGLNDVQISDIFGKINNIDDYNNYLNFNK